MATSMDVYFPFDSGDGSSVTEAQWHKMAKSWRGTGVIMAESDGLEVYGDSTGMQVKVKTGACWIEGHYGEVTPSEKTLSIAAADPSNARIDRVVARLNWSTNVIELDVLTGTAAASPTVPSLTQNTAIWEISLAQVAVGAAVSTINAGDVTDDRQVSYEHTNDPIGLIIALS